MIYDKVSNPLTPERIAAIPVANAAMTTDQLRQICVDYVRLAVSFQWVSNFDFEYDARQRSGKGIKFKEGKLHGGLPYVNVASGNLYRTMEYYDTETGVLDMKFMFPRLRHFGTACSGTVAWGWHRVINSVSIQFTAQMTQGNGFIKVGPYEYASDFTMFGSEGAPTCTEIANKNGEQVMYESYAQSRKADCFVNTGHVRMNGAEPVVVRNADGTIDGEKSYIVQVEQGLHTRGEYHKRVSEDGVEYVIQGNEGKDGEGRDYYYTFRQLFEKGYLPHTFKEFHGLAPVKKGEITAFEYEGDTFTAKVGDCKEKKIAASYVISHVSTTVSDAKGEQKIRYIKTIHPHYLREAILEDCIPLAEIEQYQKQGGHTIRVEAYLSNGEKLVAYEGTLAE